jgi:hypothetical protein
MEWKNLQRQMADNCKANAALTSGKQRFWDITSEI